MWVNAGLILIHSLSATRLGFSSYFSTFRSSLAPKLVVILERVEYIIKYTLPKRIRLFH